MIAKLKSLSMIVDTNYQMLDEKRYKIKFSVSYISSNKTEPIKSIKVVKFHFFLSGISSLAKDLSMKVKFSNSNEINLYDF